MAAGRWQSASTWLIVFLGAVSITVAGDCVAAPATPPARPAARRAPAASAHYVGMIMPTLFVTNATNMSTGGPVMCSLVQPDDPENVHDVACSIVLLDRDAPGLPRHYDPVAGIALIELPAAEKWGLYRWGPGPSEAYPGKCIYPQEPFRADVRLVRKPGAKVVWRVVDIVALPAAPADSLAR